MSLDREDVVLLEEEEVDVEVDEGSEEVEEVVDVEMDVDVAEDLEVEVDAAEDVEEERDEKAGVEDVEDETEVTLDDFDLGVTEGACEAGGVEEGAELGVGEGVSVESALRYWMARRC